MMHQPPIRCEHCGIISLFRARVPGRDGPEWVWLCLKCRCSWTVTGELREVGRACWGKVG